MRYTFPRKLQFVDAPEVRTVPKDVFRILLDYLYRIIPEDAEKAIGRELVNGQGKLFKRISKYVHGYYSIHDPYYCKQNVDRTLDRYRVEVLDISVTGMANVSYHFSDKFDWKAGDFGDHMSCFFTDKTKLMYAREKNLFIHNRVKNIRFYKEGEGCGRAWIIPVKYIGLKGRGVVFINFFGVTRQQAKPLLDEHFEGEGKEIYLTVDDDGPDLFINGNTGLLYSEEYPLHPYRLKLDKVPKKKPTPVLV